MSRVILLLVLILNLNNLYSYEKKKKTFIKKEDVRKEFLKEKNKEEIIKPFISTQTYPSNFLNKLADKLIFNIGNNPSFVIPILDSSKDLGVNYGVMPVVIMKSKKRNGEVEGVAAPSLNYNEYLGYTFAYRHYLFPTEKSLFVFRASKSENAQQELFIHYYNPEIFGTKARLNAEFRNWHNPKSSFYGYGIDSSKSDKSNYVFYLKGEEFSITLPLIENVYFDFTHAYYIHKIRNGITNTDKFSQKYPQLYSDLNSFKDFFTSRFSILFDNTDHPFIPKIGSYIIFSALFSKKNIFSDYSYSVYTLEIKDYYNYRLLDKSITAVRFMMQWQTGESIPFYAMPQLGESTGLRMAGDGRFVDRAKFVLNVEQRFTVSRTKLMQLFSELEITPFIDIGTVSPSVSKFSTGNLKYGPGIAFRIVLRPQIVGTADIAFGSEGMNTIIKVNYPF